MKNRLFFVGTFMCIMLVFFVSCNTQSGNSKTPEEGTQKKATGKISGKVVFSNTSENQNGGIIVTLEKTDGLRTVQVLELEKSRSLNPVERSIIANGTTESDGSYLFENLEPGTYTVYAASTYSSEKAVCTNVVVRAEETTVAEIMNLTATGTITGKITKDGNTTGNTGFLVFVAGTSYMAITDDTGNYKISDVPAGSGYQLVATKSGVIHIIKTNVKVNANASTSIENNNFRTTEFDAIIQSTKGDKGDKGDVGADGFSIEWLGVFDDASEIIDPQYLNAYFNKTDGCSYIWDGKEWTLLAKAGKDGTFYGDENSQNTLAIGTLLSTEEPTNQPVIITVNLTRTSLEKKGYVYSAEEPEFTDANAVLACSDFVDIKKDSDGKYKITASENGYYTIAVKDDDELVYYIQEQISNIDTVAPGMVENLNARYDKDSDTIIVTWTNPSDSDFSYADLSYTKNYILQDADEQITNGIFFLENVRADGNTYFEFLIFTVDQIGNKGNLSTISITPKPYQVGDILLNDGTVVSYEDANISEQKQKAIGVLYSIDEKGKPRGWLGIYNYDKPLAWAYSTEDLTGIKCSTTTMDAITTEFIGDTDGSDNWAYICENDISGVQWGNYKAFEKVNEYALTYGLTGRYSTGWYMPSIAELCYIYRNKDILNPILEALGGTKLSGKYWSSSQASKNNAWGVYFDTSGLLISYTKNSLSSFGGVCCIRKF